MRKKTLGALLIAGSLGTMSLAVSFALTGRAYTEPEIVREYVGKQGEKVTESLLVTGYERRDRQIDMVYANGVHVRATDIGDDLKIDDIRVVDNPNRVTFDNTDETQNVRYVSPDQKTMKMPGEGDILRYLLGRDSTSI